MKKLWSYVKEVDELYEYFPSYGEQELPERGYLWMVISSVMPEETKELIQEARRNRGVRAKEDKDLVKITPELKEEIFSVIAQKRKFKLDEWTYSY